MVLKRFIVNVFKFGLFILMKIRKISIFYSEWEIVDNIIIKILTSVLHNKLLL